jgi:carbonic anhydrase/acetyltransferase-like protein (isoleucine patch superfamily)
MDTVEKRGLMLVDYLGKRPKLHESVFVAEGAQIIGDVTIGADSSLWFNSVVRGDVNFVRIGDRTNIQDNSVIHVTYEKFPTVLASNVTVGHAAIIHGCTIEDFCLIGMGAILLDGCRIGEHSLVAAGSLVREGFKVPAKSLVAGVPARVVRELNNEELKRLEESSQHYVDYVSNYRMRSTS